MSDRDTTDRMRGRGKSGGRAPARGRPSRGSAAAGTGPGHRRGTQALHVRRRDHHRSPPQLLPGSHQSFSAQQCRLGGRRLGRLRNRLALRCRSPRHRRLYVAASRGVGRHRRHLALPAWPDGLRGARAGLWKAQALWPGIHRLSPADQPARGQSAGQPHDAEHLRSLYAGGWLRRLQLLRRIRRQGENAQLDRVPQHGDRGGRARGRQRGHDPGRRHLRARRHLQGARCRPTMCRTSSARVTPTRPSCSR